MRMPTTYNQTTGDRQGDRHQNLGVSQKGDCWPHRAHNSHATEDVLLKLQMACVGPW